MFALEMLQQMIEAKENIEFFKLYFQEESGLITRLGFDGEMITVGDVIGCKSEVEEKRIYTVYTKDHVYTVEERIGRD